MGKWSFLDDPKNVVRLLCDVWDAYTQEHIRHEYGASIRAGPKAGLKKKNKGKIDSNT
jgi:hypothetical protein